MERFSCYDIIENEEVRKKAIQLDAIAYKRSKAIENRIKLANAAIENHDIEMAYAALHIDTTIAKMLDRMDPNERKRALEDARQSLRK